MAAVDGWSGDDAFTGVVVSQLWKLAAVFQHRDGSVFSCQKDLSVSGDGRCKIGAGIANATGPVLKFAGLQVARGADAAAFNQQQAVFKEEWGDDMVGMASGVFPEQMRTGDVAGATAANGQYKFFCCRIARG